jgi:hypothetical protein
MLRFGDEARQEEGYFETADPDLVPLVQQLTKARDVSEAYSEIAMEPESGVLSTEYPCG